VIEGGYLVVVCVVFGLFCGGGGGVGGVGGGGVGGWGGGGGKDQRGTMEEFMCGICVL